MSSSPGELRTKTLYVVRTLPLTVNVDISARTHFLGFIKMGNFACIKIRVLRIDYCGWRPIM